MSDRDVLELATKELRQAYPGSKVGAGFTRARIMRSLHDRKRRKLSWWFTLGPALLLAFGGTAWGHATGRLPDLWQRAATLFTANEPASSATAMRELDKPRTVPAPASPPAAPPSAQANVPLDAETADPETELDQPQEPTRLVPSSPILLDPPRSAARPSTPRRVQPAPPPVAETTDPEPAAVEPPRPPDPDPELAAFRAGHDLHFKQGNPQSALAAYQSYLARYPSGRFVPEARYNSALNLLKLGRRDEARRQLEPFAEGRFGNYRQKEAAALLDALRAAPGPSQPPTP